MKIKKTWSKAELKKAEKGLKIMENMSRAEWELYTKTLELRKEEL